MANYLIVKSTNMNQLVKEVIELAKLGAEFKGESVAIKVGALYSAKLYIENDSQVIYNATVQKLKTVVPLEEVVVTPKMEFRETVKPTREELEAMTIAEVREATGLKGKNKQELINQFLEG